MASPATIVPELSEWSEIVRNPVAFVRYGLGVTPHRWQRDVLDAIADPTVQRIAVKSCHGPGKTALAAWAILWYLIRYPYPKIPCTAPTQHQLFDNLWPEVHKWIRRSPWELHRWLDWQRTRIAMRDEDGKPDPEWYAAARVARVSKSDASDDGEAYGLQGFHAEHLLFVIDEASGVPDPVFASVEGALATGNAKVLAIGNPNTPTGFFWRAFHREQRHWKRFTVAYTDSPHISNEWAQSMIDRYGRSHPWVQVRVFGEFPTSVEHGLVSLSWWEACSVRAHHERLISEVGGRRVLGVDVARYGTNRSVIAYATGPVVERLATFSKMSNVELANEIARAIKTHEPELIVIDAGGPGGGVIDILRDRKIPNVISWNEGSAARDRANFENARAELAWRFREKLEAGEIGVPKDDNAEAQAVNIRYFVKPNGTIRLESKDDLGRRMDSPDEFDAIRYALVPYLVGPTTAAGAVAPLGRNGGSTIPDGLLYG